ncbi:MAG TPA: phosphate acyltransferase [Terriglobales bacterium]
MDVTQYLRNKAQSDPKRVVFPETAEERILRAAREALDLKIAYPILIGKPEAVSAFAASLGVSLDGITILDNMDEALVDSYVERFIKLNAMLPAKTLKRMVRLPLNFAVMVEAVGDADCTVAGLTHTTGEVILAAQAFLGMQQGIETISSMGIWSIPGWQGSDGDLLIHADCAVCPDPNPSELADIAITTADTTRALLDIEPRVALLSFSTKGSAMHEKVDRVLEALEIVRKRRPDLLIDGELQVDSAIVPAVAAKKVKEASPVAGKANVLIFPDLNSGNIGVKLVQIFGKAASYGPLLQGFAKPITDLSRGAKVEDIVGATTNVVVLAQSAAVAAHA